MDLTTSRRKAATVLATALVAGLAAALTGPAPAAADPAADGLSATNYAPADMLAAMQRDLGLSPAEALQQLAFDATASTTEEQLREVLGEDFAGAWIDDGQQLVVAVTDPAQAAQVRAAGAVPVAASFSETDLDAAMTSLNNAATLTGTAAPDAAEVYGWHVDVATNTVVVQAAPGGEAAAAALVAASGVDAAAVTVEVSTDAPVTYYDVIGGQAYYPGPYRCSIGFSVQPRGFVTAGHCGGVGTTTRGHNQVAQGTVQRSNFPGADAGYVAVNTNWVPRPWVWRYSGNQVFVVQGSQVAAIGAATCRSGSTTGWRCGNITHRNQTVNYAEGTVTGLTRTTACAQGGDSGGSFVAANGQAQGMTSGGSGNCTFGGITFFQPLNPVLSAYGLTLVTG